MKSHVNVHKSVAGVSRVALAIGIAVLLIVFVTAYNVGTSTADPRKARLISANVQLLARKKAELAKCEETRETYSNGDKLSAAQLIETLQERKTAAKEALRLEKEREVSIRSVVQRCKNEVDDLRKRAYGAPAENISAHLGELMKKRAALLEQHKALTNTKETHRRSDLIAMQKALMQKLIEMHRQLHGTDRATACEKSPEKYSVVFDIGSSGNRVHVYKYAVNAVAEEQNATTPAAANAVVMIAPRAVSTPRDVISDVKLSTELFKFNYKALTKLPNPVEDAPGALRELFDEAKAFVPHGLYNCTPVEFKATAGLRSIGTEKAAEIVSAIRKAYRNESLWMRGSAPVRILDGNEEGPLAWLTINFLLDRFDKNSNNATVAVIDLGGGSTQVVFEPPAESFKDVPVHQQYTAQLGSRPVRAYQHSYEGFGLHAATRELLFNIQGKCQPQPPRATTTTTQQQGGGGVFEHFFGGGGVPQNNEEDGDDTPAKEANARPSLDPIAVEAFPCFAVGYTDPLGVSNTKTTGDGAAITGPNFTACVDLFHRRLLKPENEPCTSTHCGIGVTHQPPFTQFTGDIYVISFVFDLLGAANASTLAVSPEKFLAKLADIEHIGTRRCAALTLESINNATVSSSLQPAYDCMYYAYTYALLKYGYGIPEDRLLHVAKKIKGYETAWTLGASLISLA